MNAVRNRAGRLAMAGAVIGMVAALIAPNLGDVSAEPSDTLPVETAEPATAPESIPEPVPPSSEASDPSTSDAPDSTDIPTTTDSVPATDTSEPVETTQPEPTTSEPSTTEPSTTEPETTEPETTTTETAPPESTTPDGTVGPAAPGDQYDVTVTAVCDVGFAPAIHIENTGLNTAQVNVGPQSMVLAATAVWHPSWPTTDGDPPPLDPEPKWDAIRLDTLEIFEFGTLVLPSNCPPADVPSAPERVSSTAADGAVLLAWSAPLSEGGSTIADYTVEHNAVPFEDDAWTLVADGVGVETSANVTGLTNGETYLFRIRAVNATGAGVSAEAKDTPNVIPPAPSPLNVVPTLVAGELRLTWTQPSVGLPISEYTIERSVAGGGFAPLTSVGGDVTTHVDRGLTRPTVYTYRVVAHNSIGASDPSTSTGATPNAVPTPPSSLTAVPTNLTGQVRLTWVAPTSNGGSAVTDYVILRLLSGTSTWVTVADGVNTNTSYVVSGLSNGSRYYFLVRAKSLVGTSGNSNTANAIPRAVPTAPRSLTAAATGVAGQIRLSWLAPLSNGGATITDYIVQRSPNGSTSWGTIADGVNVSTAYTVTGLATGTRYFFRVIAKNAAGNSGPSNVPSAVPTNVLTAPRSLTATPTNLSGQIRLAWLAPLSNGGAAVTDYVIQRSPNGSTGWTTIVDGVNVNTAYTVTGLSNGVRYYFRVYPRNARGTGPSSNIANAVPRIVPTAPRSLVAGPTNLSGQVRLTWLAPASNGGSAITDYVIQRSPNGTTSWVTVTDSVSTATTFTVTGLTNGVRYYFRVFARNAAGQSPTSPVANGIPRAVPTAPRSLVAGPTNLSGQVRLTWLAPASNGGSAITDYVIQRSPNGTTSWVTVTDSVSTATTFTVTGLTNGVRYYFRVFARNAAGQSPASPVANGIPRTLPSAPRNFIGVGGATSDFLDWDAPASTGGSPILDYGVFVSEDGGATFELVDVTTNTSYSVPTSGTGCLLYAVAARNAAGVGPPAFDEVCFFGLTATGADASGVDTRRQPRRD